MTINKTFPGLNGKVRVAILYIVQQIANIPNNVTEVTVAYVLSFFPLNVKMTSVYVAA